MSESASSSKESTPTTKKQSRVRGRYSPTGKETRRLVQAPVSPLDADGVLAGVVGTAIWLVLTIVLFVNQEGLRAEGREWWLWVGVCGIIIGIGLTAYALWRRNRQRSRSAG